MLSLKSRRGKIAFVLALAVLLYALGAYLVLPLSVRHYEHQKRLAELLMVTVTAQSVPGDPINVGLVGSKDDVLCAMHAADWYPADRVTFLSSVKIIGSVVLHRPYLDAPVSKLLYRGRSEDLAFEKPAGKSASRRHHVRFWQVLEQGEEGRPVWLGAVTFDRGVGFSHYTGQVTHHIAADIDTDRNALSDDLRKTGAVEAIYEVTGIGPTLIGRNGGGDRYYTDGEIRISRLVEGCATRVTTAVRLDNPPIVDLKNQAWKAITGILSAADEPE